METRIQTVTPAIAKMWLDKSLGNRTLNYKRVSLYAEDMKNSRWLLNGETIKLTDKFELLDGHHRLHAVIKADTGVKMAVAIGVKKSAMATIDIGQKRSNSQIFAFEKIKNYAQVSGIVHRYLVMKETDGVFNFSGGSRNTPQILLDTYNECAEFWQNAYTIAARCYDASRLFSTVFLGSIYAWLVLEGDWDAALVERFLNCASNFNDMSISQAVLLRNTVQKKLNSSKVAGGRMDYSYLSSLFAVAFNAMVANRKLRSINVDFGGWVKFEKKTKGKLF